MKKAYFLRCKRLFNSIIVLILFLTLASCAQKSLQENLTCNQHFINYKTTIEFVENPPEFTKHIIDGPGKGAAVGAGIGAEKSVGSGARTMHDAGFAIGVVLAPVVATGTAIYGAIVSPSSEEVEKTLHSIEYYVESTDTQKQLRGALQKLLKNTNTPIQEKSMIGPSSLTNTSEHVVNGDPDAILEVGLAEIGLHAKDLKNEKIRLNIKAFSRLTKTSDNSIVCENEHNFSGSGDRALSQLGDNDAEIFKENVSQSIEKIAEIIFYNYFPDASTKQTDTSSERISHLGRIKVKYITTLLSLPGWEGVEVREIDQSTEMDAFKETDNWVKVKTTTGEEGWIAKKWIQD